MKGKQVKSALSSARLHTLTTRCAGAVLLISVSLVLSRQWTCARRYGRHGSHQFHNLPSPHRLLHRYHIIQLGALAQPGGGGHAPSQKLGSQENSWLRR